jgi:hypothetical protein
LIEQQRCRHVHELDIVLCLRRAREGRRRNVTHLQWNVRVGSNRRPEDTWKCARLERGKMEQWKWSTLVQINERFPGLNPAGGNNEVPNVSVKTSVHRAPTVTHLDGAERTIPYPIEIRSMDPWSRARISAEVYDGNIWLGKVYIITCGTASARNGILQRGLYCWTRNEFTAGRCIGEGCPRWGSSRWSPSARARSAAR